MSDQANAWSRVAESYDDHFIDPWREDVENPLPEALRELADQFRTIADLGCGTGPLLPWLSELFECVHAVDFAKGMLEKSRERCKGRANVHFHEDSLTNLRELPEVEVALAVNSLVLAHPVDLQQSINAIYDRLCPEGALLGIVPAMDSIHYHTMLLMDHALQSGQTLEQAQKTVAMHAEHSLYRLDFGEFRYRGLIQHFWQPFEIVHRLTLSGFAAIQLEKVHLTWDQFPQGWTLDQFPPPWDWFFRASKPPESDSSLH
mgnify:CR=1 FL=1